MFENIEKLLKIDMKLDKQVCIDDFIQIALNWMKKIRRE